MAEHVSSDLSTDAVMVSEAFASARELLRRAEEDAADLRAEADRYVRRREHEAELLIGKARRLLAMAEERAGAIAAARGPVERAIDVDAAAAPPMPSGVEVDLRVVPTGLDGILASAIARAVDRSFPPPI